MSEMEVRVVCVKSDQTGRVNQGDTGTLVFGADYVPGWDGGRWTVEPDKYPEASPFGHLSVSYWTEQEMLLTWKPVGG
jgi:hypothetical protein